MAPSTIEFLEGYIIQSVKQALKKYGKDDTFKIHSLEGGSPVQDIFADHMSIILLWSAVGSMTLKAHFSLQTAMKLAAKVLERPFDQITEQSAMDFMREFNNIVG